MTRQEPSFDIPALDIRVEDHGSLCVFWARTDKAQAWLTDNLDADGFKAGPKGFIVEPRYAGAIIGGAVEAGLEVRI